MTKRKLSVPYSTCYLPSGIFSSCIWSGMTAWSVVTGSPTEDRITISASHSSWLFIGIATLVAVARQAGHCWPYQMFFISWVLYVLCASLQTTNQISPVWVGGWRSRSLTSYLTSLLLMHNFQFEPKLLKDNWDRYHYYTFTKLIIIFLWGIKCVFPFENINVCN